MHFIIAENAYYLYLCVTFWASLNPKNIFFSVEAMHAQLKMIDHAPSVQMQDAPGSILYSLKNENGEDKENLEELGDSNPALNDIRNSELELEERRAVAENEFYDGDR